MPLRYDRGMIGKLTGAFGGTTPDGSALIEVGGVGYVVRLPAQAGAPALLGERVILYIHTAVREDAIDLYGFPAEDELQFFKQLMSVSGIGPKTALGIMSVADVGALRHAIARGEAAALTATFGIGKKNAERLVVELRDKVKLHAPAEAHGGGADDGEVIDALLGLGYSAGESRAALRAVAPSAVGTRERLAAALRHLGGASAV